MATNAKNNINDFGMMVRRGELISCKVLEAQFNPLATQQLLNRYSIELSQIYLDWILANTPDLTPTLMLKKLMEFIPIIPPYKPSGLGDKDLGKLVLDKLDRGIRQVTANSTAALSLNRSSSSIYNRNRSSQNRNRNRSSQNRNRNRSGFDLDVSANAMGWRELRGLCHIGMGAAEKQKGSIWENLDLRPPPGPDKSMEETGKLLSLQRHLKSPVQQTRREEIVAQAGFSLDDYTSPLGIDEAGGFEMTRALLTVALEVSNEIGLYYKSRFSRLRPNMIQPLIRPFIAVPSHASYPSNHSFQSFAVAEMFARIYPEHPGCNALFLRAQRIAENREWAGLHYRSDTEAGKDLAKQTVAYIAEALDDLMFQAQQEWIN